MLKTFPKILIIFFLTVFVIQLICLFFILVAPAASQAADVKFTPQVVQDLGYTFNASDKTTGNIANLVKAIYKYAIGIVGILAAVVLMVGGVLWIVAGGNATAIGEAKSWIAASLTGLILALTSYLILATVNPALVDLKTTGIKTVTPTTNTTAGDTGTLRKDGCCDGMCIAETTKATCSGTWLSGTSYTCSAEGRCVAADTTKGCCKFSLSGDPRERCAARTEAECTSEYDGKPAFTYIGFDNSKVCVSGVGLGLSYCVNK